MSRLLSADFARLKKNKFFWICTAGMFLLGIFMSAVHYISMQKYGENDPQLTNILFAYALVIILLVPAFVSLFTGTEYSDGTIRNKLIIGHTRVHIYLSGLIVCTTAALIFCISYIAGAFAVALPLYTIDPADQKSIVILILCSFVMTAAFTALCTLAAMLCQNKALTAVINILTACFLLVASVYVLNKLTEPETLPMVTTNDSGGVTEVKEESNPYYITGTEREICQFVNDFLPTGQAVNIAQAGGAAQSPGLLAAYSACIIIVSTGIGMFAFKKKDIK